jgi:hypothetical protein
MNKREINISFTQICARVYCVYSVDTSYIFMHFALYAYSRIMYTYSCIHTEHTFMQCLDSTDAFMHSTHIHAYGHGMCVRTTVDRTHARARARALAHGAANNARTYFRDGSSRPAERGLARVSGTDRDRQKHKVLVLLTACLASRQIMGQWKNTSIVLASMQGGGKN